LGAASARSLIVIGSREGPVYPPPLKPWAKTATEEHRKKIPTAKIHNVFFIETSP
jgi:hypothetical protein